MDIQSLPYEIQTLIFLYTPNPVAELIRNLNMKKEMIYKRSKNYKYKKYCINGFDEYGDICEYSDVHRYLYGDSDSDDEITIEKIEMLDDSNNSCWYVQNEWKKEKK